MRISATPAKFRFRKTTITQFNFNAIPSKSRGQGKLHENPTFTTLTSVC
jgi:hypothetical protein